MMPHTTTRATQTNRIAAGLAFMISLGGLARSCGRIEMLNVGWRQGHGALTCLMMLLYVDVCAAQFSVSRVGIDADATPASLFPHKF